MADSDRRQMLLASCQIYFLAFLVSLSIFNDKDEWTISFLRENTEKEVMKKT